LHSLIHFFFRKGGKLEKGQWGWEMERPWGRLVAWSGVVWFRSCWLKVRWPTGRTTEQVCNLLKISVDIDKGISCMVIKPIHLVTAYNFLYHS
jgi:hypothetical protein